MTREDGPSRRATHVEHEVVYAAVGASAAPDLLLVDFQLDDGDDGLAVVDRLRVALCRPIPALIMTGDVSAVTRQRIADSGLPMLEKPVSGLQLRTVMTRLLQRA